jgi:hypothetical protein
MRAIVPPGWEAVKKKAIQSSCPHTSQIAELFLHDSSADPISDPSSDRRIVLQDSSADPDSPAPDSPALEFIYVLLDDFDEYTEDLDVV